MVTFDAGGRGSLAPHGDRAVEHRIGDEGSDQRKRRAGQVAHAHDDPIAPPVGVDLESSWVEAGGGGEGAGPGGAGAGVDRCGPGRLPGGVFDQEPVAPDEGQLQDQEDAQDEHGKPEGELDGGLAAAGATTRPSRSGSRGNTLPITVSRTALNNDPMRLDLPAHAMNTRATVAAPRRTSAYSAVDWPAVLRVGVMGTR